MGGVSYSVAVAGRLPVAQQRGWERRVLGATRRRTTVLLWKHLERYGPRHADVNPSRKVHCEHQRRYALCPWSATAKVTSAGWA